MEAEKRASHFIKENTQFKDYTILEFATYLTNSNKRMSKDYVELDKKQMEIVLLFLNLN